MPIARLVTELIGTFFLVLAVGLAGFAGAQLGALAIASALMVMVYMGGHLSGAHYNPAVTLGVFLRGSLPAKDVGPYMVSQLAGAILAGLACWAITGRTFAVHPGPESQLLPLLLIEILFTFALVLVVLNVATDPKTSGNSYYGLAIGFTVFVGAVVGGPISGGAFNPAVGLGPNIVHAMNGGSEALLGSWVYLVGPFAGGIAAAIVYKVQHPGDPVGPR